MEENKEVLKEEQNIKPKKNKKNNQLEEIMQKLKTYEEDALRAKADLINYRKRKDEEVTNLLKYANADIVMSLLPIMDNFERALNIKDESKEITNYLEGFKLIYNDIKELLNKNDVIEIPALGKEFDPLMHHSVSIKKDETKESGIVLEVFQKGYTYKGKVLRPAMVIINE